VILNPRRIPAAIKAFNALPIRKCWLSGYTEGGLVPIMADVIKAAAGADANFGDHDPILVISDDAIVEAEALSAVLRALAAGHPVATGYSRLSKHDDRVNLTKSPLRTFRPDTAAYNLYTIQEVEEWPVELVPTWFAGLALTGMTRAMWERFPFQVFNEPHGCCSDFSLSIRLQEAGVPIVAPRAGYVEHLKVAPWGHGDGNLLLGSEYEDVRYA
jgi:GT2 family glycosyltransferase